METSYTITGNIRNFLDASDKLRAKILLTSQSTKTEREIKWFFIIERIKWAMSFSDNPLSDFEISKIISHPFPKKPNRVEREVFALKNVFEYLKEEWTCSPLLIDISVIKKIYDIGCKPYMGKFSGQTDISTKMVENVLKFLNQGKEHPIIQAGIIHAEFINARLIENGNQNIARLLSYLVLYKNGYDIRGLFALDEFHKKDVVTYRELLERTVKEKSMTTWLEYYSYGVMQTLKNTHMIISGETPRPKPPKSLMKINSRQREALSILEKPGSKITNKEFQKIFGISQITASRDLSKLVSFGLALSHGKGRSVYYTKA